METRNQRQAALVELGADLRARALRLTDDVNASYLLVHEVIAEALRKEVGLEARAALEDALMQRVTNKLADGRISHRVMP